MLLSHGRETIPRRGVVCLFLTARKGVISTQTTLPSPSHPLAEHKIPFSGRDYGNCAFRGIGRGVLRRACFHGWIRLGAPFISIVIGRSFPPGRQAGHQSGVVCVELGCKAASRSSK